MRRFWGFAHVLGNSSKQTSSLSLGKLTKSVKYNLSSRWRTELLTQIKQTCFITICPIHYTLQKIIKLQTAPVSHAKTWKDFDLLNSLSLENQMQRSFNKRHGDSAWRVKLHLTVQKDILSLFISWFWADIFTLWCGVCMYCVPEHINMHSQSQFHESLPGGS